MKNAKCPYCDSKFSIWMQLRMMLKTSFLCYSCNRKILIKYSRSFNWGYWFGFIGFVLPSFSVLFVTGSFVYAFTAGLIGALLGGLFVVCHTYITSHFE